MKQVVIYDQLNIVELIARYIITVMVLYSYAQTPIAVDNQMVMYAMGIFMLYWTVDPLLLSFRNKKLMVEGRTK